MVFSFFKKKQSPIEVISVLRNAGISLSSETAQSTVVADVLGAEGSGGSMYENVLCSMGDEQYDPDSDRILPWLSNDVWHFDYEAIEDHGSYVSIVNNCARLAQGDLQISELSDHVDIENEIARVSFRLDGKKFVYNLRCDNDWADPTIFSLLSGNLKGRGSEKKFFEHNLFGQDCLIVCKSQLDVENINRATGLRFEASKG